MACGIPALATRSTGPTAIIESGRTGWLVEPDDEAALTAALVQVVNDTSDRERRGRAARRAVREQYSWTQIASELATVLEDVVTETVAGEALSLVELD